MTLLGPCTFRSLRARRGRRSSPSDPYVFAALECRRVAPRYVPVARTDDQIVDAERFELAMQHEAEASGFVAGMDLADLPGLLLDPGEELVRIELLRSLRRLSVVLADEDVFLLVDVDVPARFASGLVANARNRP